MIRLKNIIKFIKGLFIHEKKEEKKEVVYESKWLEYIDFKEGQNKIYVGKHKITKSPYEGYIELHLVYSYEETSGYKGKFVRVLTVENVYNINTFKNIKVSHHEENFDFTHWDSGGYDYDKNSF